jgi:hypothetical protein
MSDRRVVYARVHIVAWAVWAGTWIVAIIASGTTQIFADSPMEYLGLGILIASSFTLVGSTVGAKLEVAGMRATTGPISAAGAMLGAMLPAAWTLARTPQQGSGRGGSDY